MNGVWIVYVSHRVTVVLSGDPGSAAAELTTTWVTRPHSFATAEAAQLFANTARRDLAGDEDADVLGPEHDPRPTPEPT